MTSDEGDRRIEEREQELARLQTEQTTDKQFEANLEREKLMGTLTSGAAIARLIKETITELAQNFDAAVNKMADDLTGREGNRLNDDR